MSKDVELSSGRLIYKPITTGYCTDRYLQWLNDEAVVRYLEIFEPYTKEKLYQYLLSAEKNKELYFWAIHLKENNKHIGNIKIDPIDHQQRTGEYGIMMGDKNEWGKKYAFEASETAIRFCFEQLGLKAITLGVVEDNENALNLYKKLGFKIETVTQDYGYYNGKLCNMVRMIKLNNAMHS